MRILPVVGSILLVIITMVSCGGNTTEQQKVKRVGVLNLTPTLEPVVQGFKEQLAQEGFVEGKDVVFLYRGPTRGGAMQQAVDEFAEQKVDMVFFITSVAGNMVMGKPELARTPTVFAVVADPVKSGFVKSIKEPGGRVTGVTTGNPLPEGLAHLGRLVSGLKRVYVPYNPDNKSHSAMLPGLKQGADLLGMELVLVEVRTKEEVLRSFKEVPEDVQAMVELPSGFWGPYVAEFVQGALDHKLPLLGANLRWVKAGATLAVGFDSKVAGSQVGRLAAKILRGVSPAAIPVEMAENFLSLNLKTAKSIGVEIPQGMLKEAYAVVR